MKSSHPAESASEFASSAPSHYSPSVPMTVYRELAAELRANKAVIDSLNSRNQQLLNQNRVLKQEIHNVVQATLHLGQFAGVARQTDGSGQTLRPAFPNAIAPDTLAKLARGENNPSPEDTYKPHPSYPNQLAPQAIQPPKAPSATPATSRNRVPRPIGQSAAKHSMKAPTVNSAARDAAREAAKEAARISERASMVRQQAPQPQQVLRRVETNRNRTAIATKAPAKIPAKSPVKPPTKMMKSPAPKLFTENSGSYRSASLESSEDKEIGGIWLVLSIILIIVTAFGAGFLIMKPLLNDR